MAMGVMFIPFAFGIMGAGDVKWSILFNLLCPMIYGGPDFCFAELLFFTFGNL